MNSVTQEYIIDLSSNNNFVQVPVVQGDGNETRYVDITLIENGVPYPVDVSTMSVLITGTKPDGKEIWNTCEITDEGHIKVHITYQMTAVEGRGIYQITIYSKEKNNQLKSFPFFILVTPAAYDPSYIISTDEFEALAEYTTAAEAAAKRCEEIYDDIALIGTIGVMNIDRTDGHLYFKKSNAWEGVFSIIDSKNLQVQWNM